jgi:putative FmdB family regulatory protein
MPLYEYECQRCGRLFDGRRGIKESDSEIICPTCGETEPKRLFSRFATNCSEAGCHPTGFS